MEIPSKEEIHKILNEPFKTFREKDAVKLPCKCGTMIERVHSDQYVVCPKCLGKWLMISNKYGSTKLYKEQHD
jgi:DNA-directed RNA polymerase subunit RPC12/RpoP